MAEKKKPTPKKKSVQFGPPPADAPAPTPAPKKPGPAPEMYKIEGNWEDAVKKSFQKKKPAGGWPK